MRVAIVTILCAVLSAVVLYSPVACNPATPKASRSPRGDSIILITVDSLRSDRLGCYAGDRKTTPAIDALASRGVRFTRAYTASPSTTRSWG